jgi:hypothetical protein
VNQFLGSRRRLLALGVGAIVFAACGGSSTSAPDTPTTLFQKNASLLTNVKHYSGVSNISNYAKYMATDFPEGSFATGDQFAFDFDVNFDAVDANPALSASTSGGMMSMFGASLSGVDFRNAFSNFTLKSVGANVGQVDLSQITWAKCPLKVSLVSRYNSVNPNELLVTFAEAPTAALASDNCHPVVETKERYGHFYDIVYGLTAANFSDSVGNLMEAKGAKFTLRFQLGMPSVVIPQEGSPKLRQLFSTGLETFSRNLSPFFSGGYSRKLLVRPYSDNPIQFSMSSFNSGKVKDYTPFELAAVAGAAGIDAEWKRSVDLASDDVATSYIEASKDDFKTILASAQVPSSEAVEKVSLPSCELDPKNSLKAGTTISLRVKALDINGVSSAYTDVASVVKTADNIACPEAKLTAPSGVTAAFDVAAKEYSLSWQKPAETEGQDISYCIEWSSDSFASTDNESRSCVGPELSTTVAWGGQSSRSFRVIASSENGVVSLPSDVVQAQAPQAEAVSDVALSFTDDGVKVSWKPAVQTEGVTGALNLLKWGEVKNGARGQEFGSASVSDVSTYLVSKVELNKSFAAGVEVWFDVVGCTEFSCSKAVSANIVLPKAAVPLPEVDSTVAASTGSTEVTQLATTTIPVTTPAVAPTTVVAVTTVPQPSGSPGCFIVGTVRGCGPYVLLG